MALDVIPMEPWTAKCPCCGCKLDVEWQLAIYGDGSGDSPQFVGLTQAKEIHHKVSFLVRRGKQPSKRVGFTVGRRKRVSFLGESRHEIVQLPNPITKRWTKIDKTTGRIISHKASPGAYAGVTIVGEVKCDCTHMKKRHCLGDGQCVQCGCTWFHPAIEYCKPIKKGTTSES